MKYPPDKYADYACKMRNANGDPCESPALKGEDFCHYHKVMGPNPINYDNQLFPSTHVYLPRLESAASIQAAISEVCELMLHRRIEPKEASALFYAMQVASQNLAPLNGTSNARKTRPPDGTPNPETSNSSTGSTTAPDPLPPGTIQASAGAPPRRRRRPRQAVPQLVRAR